MKKSKVKDLLENFSTMTLARICKNNNVLYARVHVVEVSYIMHDAPTSLSEGLNSIDQSLTLLKDSQFMNEKLQFSKALVELVKN